jgi:hypothetical protein
MIDPRPEAQAALNKRAEELLSRVQIFSFEKLDRESPRFEPRIEIAGHIREADIKGPITSEEIDIKSNKVSKIMFQSGSSMAGIEGEACDFFDALVTKALQCFQISLSVSYTTAKNLVREWLRLRFEEQTKSDFVHTFKEGVRNVVTTLEILIPIASLHIQSDFTLGKVNFRTITKEMVDKWHELKSSASQDPTTKTAVEEHLRRERQELQGLAAASVSLEAEPECAAAQALDLADDAVSFLSIFHPANLAPHLICHARPLGQEYIPRFKLFLTTTSGGITFKQGILKPFPDRWLIDDSMLRQINDLGLVKLSDLLTQDKPTEFQKKLLSVLLMYSRNSRERKPVEKLVYVLVALESTLLKNQQEPIQQNVGERLAFRQQ